MRMTKYALPVLLTLLHSPGNALNFSSTLLVLNCPGRENLQIVLHAYGHTQEKWGNNFETGAGHKTAANIDIVPFVNGDILLYDRTRRSFGYVYYGRGPIQHCIQMTERNIHPTF